MRYRRGLVVGVICVVLTNAITLTQPHVLRLAVDDLYRGVTSDKLARYALILLGIAALAGVFKYLMRHFVIGISRHVENDLRNELFAHLQTLPLEYYQRTRTGEIMSRATNDLSAVRMMLGPGIMYMVNTVTVAAVSVACMAAISPLVSLTVWFFGDRIHHRFEAIQAQFAEISARVQENLSGVRVIRAVHGEAREVETFREMNREYLERSQGLIRVWGVFYPMLGFLSGVAALLALYLGGREVVHRHITLGQFVAFTVYLGMLNWPVVALGWVINLFQRGTASYRRLVEILEVAPSIHSPPRPHRPAAVTGELEFRNLTFTYPGAARPALRDLSLRVSAGQTIALVGRTGAGKTTLMSLVPRVFDPPPGTVFLDGVDVRLWDLDALRAAIALVPQETFLFTATLAENIGYGVDQAPRDAVERVARIARLDDEARGFPSGYDTVVGERGITLSGGQRQRTAIARGLLRDAPLLLLDDCLSSVDTQTEAAILHGLRVEMRQRTSLLVSHRVSTVRDADLIVVLEDGIAVERGTHDALVALDGRYAELDRQQQLEEELEAS
jgi:ATP-binding cassette subfamily B multidrug efflux pump